MFIASCEAQARPPSLSLRTGAGDPWLGPNTSSPPPHLPAPEPTTPYSEPLERLYAEQLEVEPKRGCGEAAEREAGALRGGRRRLEHGALLVQGRVGALVHVGVRVVWWEGRHCVQ